MGESKNACRVLVGRQEGKRPLGRPRRRWEDNIKMDLREVGCDGRDWINLTQDRDFCEGGNEPPASLKARCARKAGLEIRQELKTCIVHNNNIALLEDVHVILMIIMMMTAMTTVVVSARSKTSLRLVIWVPERGKTARFSSPFLVLANSSPCEVGFKSANAKVYNWKSKDVEKKELNFAAESKREGGDTLDIR
ncbi:hypothetical protein ANN_02013 [Periplaneta americana]|uniref:Uncharacterized protein n=1 Tax=Periplaneta americana TaxID=6978 RepID=A0ABQ8TXL1_PERAM|nr:hypothetical protein ANN_02013 [Periplaneta americana]